MLVGPIVAAVLLSNLSIYWNALPLEIQRSDSVLFGLLVGLGTVLGELPNSFLKRQLDIPPGARRNSPAGWCLNAFDQADLVLGIAVCLLPLWMVPLEALFVVLVLVTAGHVVLNHFAHALGMRPTAW
jgi:hypothetical protein